MKAWLIDIAEVVILVIDAMALFHHRRYRRRFRRCNSDAPFQRGEASKWRKVWLRYAHVLVAALTFQASGRPHRDCVDPNLPQLFPGT